MARGDVMVITGATSGVGFSVAEVAADAGYRVALAGRNEDKGRKAVQALASKGYDVEFFHCDVCKHEDLEQLMQATEKRFGAPPSVVFANAGMAGHAESVVESSKSDTFDKVLDLNVKGVLHTLGAAVPYLERSKGTFLAMGSCFACMSFPNHIAYTASKAAVTSIVRTAADELQAQNIRAFSINPCIFDTGVIKEASDNDVDRMAKEVNPCGHVGDAKVLGRFLLDLVDGKYPQYKSGSGIAVDGNGDTFPLEECATRCRKK